MNILSMNRLNKIKVFLVACCSLFIASCGDFPDYSYDRSNDYCVMQFPFAGGMIGRQYVGFFKVISTLQYLDDDPTYQIIVTDTADFNMEQGSVQKFVIGDKTFKPEFKRGHLLSELQQWGPGFVLDEDNSAEIYKLLQEGNDLTIIGRLEIGHQYETDIYNFFFETDDEPFRACINRLLDDDDMRQLEQLKLGRSKLQLDVEDSEIDH